MIQPGQKLKEGDFVKDISVDQAHDLLKLDSNKPFDIGFYSITCAMNGITYGNGTLYHSGEAGISTTEHTFTDFRQLCINTFNNKTEL